MSATQTESTARTAWQMTGTGYEFCNCQPGCTCNFSGFPTSPDGSCKAAVVNTVESGRCGDVDLSGVTALAVIDWPKAIHDGGGRVVFVVPPSVTDEQLDCLAQIYTGALGGMPWEILGSTYEVAGVVRADVHVDEAGIESGFTADGVGEARGTTLRNPVTGDPHGVAIDLEQGFIWKRGDCGQGSFRVKAGELELEFQDSNWIHYRFDWSNSA